MNKQVNLGSFSMKNVVDGILKYFLPILIILSCLVMIFMAFIETFDIPPEWQTTTLFALTGALLSYNIWLTAYKKLYEELIHTDRETKEYSIHRRYYFARKPWKLPELQKALEQAKVEFREAWLRDVEEITGRTIEQIKVGKYRKNSYKFLIWRVKHRKYPKFGIKFARQMQSVLDVGSASSMSVKIKAAETFFRKNAMQKAIITLLSLFLTGSIVIEIVSGSIWTALLKVVIAIIAIFMSLLFGSLNGNLGARKKLAIAEEVSKLLEEWKDITPYEEPFKSTIINSEIKTETVTTDIFTKK